VPCDNAVLQWNEETLECVRATRPAPTVAARALFVVHAAAYDSWAAYDARAVPTIRTGFTRRPSSQRTLANKTAAVGYAAHRALAYLAGNNPFQPCRPELDGRLASMGLNLAEATASSPATNPGRDAKRAADNIANARRNDGANQAGNYADTSGYRPVNTPDVVVDPWRWQPVRVPLGDPSGGPQTPATPHWSRVTSFDPKLLESAGQVPNPFNLNAQERSAMVDELVRLSAELNDRTKAIAEYWADGPGPSCPPGTGTCSPSGCRAAGASRSTPTPRCSSASTAPCWTPASPPGATSTDTTSPGRCRPSRPCGSARRSGPGPAPARAPG
jgi:hypothetical protein